MNNLPLLAELMLHCFGAMLVARGCTTRERDAGLPGPPRCRSPRERPQV
jgi:hypothetical protein